MKELRVAIFTGNYNHIADGVALTLNRIVDYLNSNNIPVLVFGPSNDKPAIKHSGDFIVVPSIPFPGRGEYRLSISFPDDAQKKLEEFKPTIVDIITPDLLGYRALRYAQYHDIQAVASYHTHFTSYLKYYNLDLIEPMIWKYVAWFYDQCCHIYVPTQSMAEDLGKHDIKKGVKIWERGVDNNIFKPENRDMEWRRSLGVQDNEILVSFVSRLVWEKDLNTVAETAKKIQKSQKQIRFLIVGDGPARKEFEKMIPNAIFTGFLTGNELARAYASSDIFFFPSETETFGVVTLEAMASGVPCVVANATGSKSLITNDQHGFLVEPKKHQKFAEAIIKLADNHNERSRMSEACREKALTYDWSILLPRLIDLYKEALGQPRPEIKYWSR